MKQEGRPVLVTSLASAVLLDGRGDLELTREARGAPSEWGGVYSQLTRLTGPWTIRLRMGDSGLDLPSATVSTHVGPGSFESHHRWTDLEADQLVAAIPDPPGALRTLRLVYSGARPASIVVESRWSPYLLPVLVEGIRPVHYLAEVQGGSVRVRQGEFGLEFRCDPSPQAYHFNDSSWVGVSFDGPLRTVSSDHEVQLATGRPVELRFLVHGGLQRELGPSATVSAALESPAAQLQGIDASETTWLSQTPDLRFPNAPELERAYSFARTSLRRLYAAPGDDMYGLVAGFPWYSSIWCRDLAWMLPAVLWLGDADWVERTLSTVFRFQSHSDLPILGGGRGELPMQISPGPLFLFGTSDTSLYFPSLVERFVFHSGRRSAARSWYGPLQEILGWGESRCTIETGLIRHGGEALSIGSVRTSLAQVQFGIEAPDTTIWDSTDRRSHAIDVEVLWAEALRAGARLLAEDAHTGRCARWAALADQVEENVRRAYPWVDESYLYDSLRAEGPLRKLRPNALRAVSAGWFDPAFARAMVQRARKEDLTTDWGVRTLSSRDPSYDPQAYHDGQVWTIATAWAADAAFAVGDVSGGMAYLKTIADLMEREGGFANECYRGDRPEAFNSCFLLGLSVGPFLTVLFERLWGLRVDATRPLLEVRPNFPAGWTSASMKGLRIGADTVGLEWSPRTLHVDWAGASSLHLVGPLDEVVVPGHGQGSVRLG